MSKTQPNCVFLDDTPETMITKLMSADDNLITHYLTHATHMPLSYIQDIQNRLNASAEHPRDIKLEAMSHIIELYHGAAGIAKAQEYFAKVIQGGGSVEGFDVPEVVIEDQIDAWIELDIYKLPALLKYVGLCKTTAEARDAIAARAVRIDDEVMDFERSRYVVMNPNISYIIKVGKKRLLKVRINSSSIAPVQNTIGGN
jgi:tyrosyl-tRNA synthetase